MSKDTITAKLKPGIETLRFYVGQSVYFNLNEIVEVRDINGNILPQVNYLDSASNIRIDYVCTSNPSLDLTSFRFDKSPTSNIWDEVSVDTTNYGAQILKFENNPTLPSIGFILIKVIYRKGISILVESFTYLKINYEVVEQPTDLIGYIPPSSMIANDDLTIVSEKEARIDLLTKDSTSGSTWIVENLPVGMTFNGGNRIEGIPKIIDDYDVIIKLIYKEEYNGPIMEDVKTITISVVAGKPEIVTSGFEQFYSQGQGVYIPVINLSVGNDTKNQLLATHNPESYTATGLPAGLTINNSGQIVGSPSDVGVYLTSIYATNSLGDGPSQIFKFNIAHPSSSTPTSPTFLKNDGVDIFFDLQSRALTLTPPKAEAEIASDTKVINSLVADRLMVKTGETLWLNVRFVKGTTPLDPVATGLRFGVAGKLGGPLLMEGDTFTKVGEGSSAYYRMRVAPIENEFSAIIDDYYDDDAVEQISAANENQPSSSGEVEGLCEVALTTGTGETIAEIKSDTLGVLLKRSIF